MSFWSRIERRLEGLAEEWLPDEFLDRLNEARRTVAGGNLTAALAMLNDLVSERPEHVGALVLLGLVQLRVGAPGEARDLFDRALAQDRESPDALLGRGEAGLALGAAADAVAYFRAAVDAAGGDRQLLAAAYRGLGQAYGAAGEIDKAIRELRKAVAEDPDDAETLAALGQALVLDPSRSNEEARRYLERIAAREGCPSAAWHALGTIALEENDVERAEGYFRNILETSASPEDVRSAWVGVGKSWLSRGDGAQALEALDRALEVSRPDASLVSLRGQALEELGEEEVALGQYDRSLAMAESADVARRALALALRSGRIERSVGYANIVLGANSSDGLALAARGRELLARGQIEAAHATLRSALGSDEDFEALVSLAELELGRDDAAVASTYALRALHRRPSSDEARQLVARVRAAALGVRLDPAAGWYDLVHATLRLCRAHPALALLTHPVTQALTEFDQPLLVTVMGEFSSGKSSFVNAFLGAEVAPTGITPTTATINIVKYGRERGGRVVYRDGTSAELEATELARTLRELDDLQARRVEHVELLMPIEVLERVNIVDTPGLNSILPEHEAVARAFLQRADAVVWLFTATQAGKASEKMALDSIREQGVRVLGVLNKVDELAPGEVEEILRYIHGELGERIEACIPVSARAALAGDGAGNWSTLTGELEERFFTQARAIKCQALDRRLERVLGEAQALSRAETSGSSERAEGLRAAARRAELEQARFLEESVDRERQRLEQAMSELYQTAAREVLELVRPRKIPFGSHTAARADRDYLLGLLDSGFERLVRDSQARTEEVLRSSSSTVLANLPVLAAEQRSGIEETLRESLLLLDAEVFGRCAAFVRGYLRGGTIDRFFAEDLPKLSLNQDATYHALYKNAPDLDSEMTLPLARACTRVLAELARRLDTMADTAEVAAFEMDAGLRRAVEDLMACRESLSRAAGT